MRASIVSADLSSAEISPVFPCMDRQIARAGSIIRVVEPAIGWRPEPDGRNPPRCAPARTRPTISGMLRFKLAEARGRARKRSAWWSPPARDTRLPRRQIGGEQRRGATNLPQMRVLALHGGLKTVWSCLSVLATGSSISRQIGGSLSIRSMRSVAIVSVWGLSPVLTVLLRFVHGIDDRRALREVDIVSSSSRKSFALIFISILSAMLAEWLAPVHFCVASAKGNSFSSTVRKTPGRNRHVIKLYSLPPL